MYALNFIIVNDGSVNQDIQEQVKILLAKNIPINFISNSQNKGKGFALRAGVNESKANYIIYTDIDFPFTNQSMQGLMNELLTNKFDVVVGIRSDNYYQKKMSRFRKILSKSFRLFIRKFLNMKISDTQCGLKGFNLKGKEKFLQTTINRYLFDFEFIYSVSNDHQLNMASYEVRLKDGVIFRKMPIKVLLQEAFNLLKILLRQKN